MQSQHCMNIQLDRESKRTNHISSMFRPCKDCKLKSCLTMRTVLLGMEVGYSFPYQDNTDPLDIVCNSLLL